MLCWEFETVVRGSRSLFNVAIRSSLNEFDVGRTCFVIRRLDLCCFYIFLLLLSLDLWLIRINWRFAECLKHSAWFQNWRLIYFSSVLNPFIRLVLFTRMIPSAWKALNAKGGWTSNLCPSPLPQLVLISGSLNPIADQRNARAYCSRVCLNILQ